MMDTGKSYSKLITRLMGFLLAIFVAGCGSDGGSSAQPGTLGVSMTDAPPCGFDEVNVTVSKVRVHQSDNASENAVGWTDITLNPARKINLLTLIDPTQKNRALEMLGETPLAAGHYTQLRLVLVPNRGSAPTANSVVLSGQTTEIPLDTPSSVQSGIKLIHQFTVESGQRIDLLLDFDACTSIVQTGNGTYKLKPVIKVIPFVSNGIDGFIDKTLLVNNVIVSAQLNGEIVRATVPNTQTGEFFLAHLDPKDCITTTCYDVVITADSRATAVIASVPVPSSTSITTVSTSDAPIPVVTPPTLEVSATHHISGTVTLNPATDVTVVVAAMQALNGGPIVTVKSQTASVNPTGDFAYNLMLPIAAPSLGPYATPLPIVFTQQPAAVAGHYTVQASATGYMSQSSLAPVDISGGDATSQDFTLTP